MSSTSSACPTLVRSLDYHPYGAVARSWGTVTTGYTYAGLFAQTNTDLLLSTTHAYNPANGKWLNVDPIREQGGINLTSYVGGGPMAAIDPEGKYLLIVGVVFGGVLVILYPVRDTESPVHEGKYYG